MPSSLGLAHLGPGAIVHLYAQRMRIEQSFRDAKNLRHSGQIYFPVFLAAQPDSGGCRRSVSTAICDDRLGGKGGMIATRTRRGPGDGAVHRRAPSTGVALGLRPRRS